MIITCDVVNKNVKKILLPINCRQITSHKIPWKFFCPQIFFFHRYLSISQHNLKYKYARNDFVWSWKKGENPHITCSDRSMKLMTQKVERFLPLSTPSQIWTWLNFYPRSSTLIHIKFAASLSLLSKFDRFSLVLNWLNDF